MAFGFASRADYQSDVASPLASFLSPIQPSLKVCGVTTAADAHRLADLGVDALGVNFWPESKRYCPPAEARSFLPDLAGRIVRVGVFVNADPALPRGLFEEGLLDLVQFHGDETIDSCIPFAAAGIPYLKAVGVTQRADLEDALAFQAQGLLLDAHAPGLYGGTGQTIDWEVAARFVSDHPDLPIILAGGITPQNAGAALQAVRPAALDTASGSESSPGIKDFEKVAALLAAVRQEPPHPAPSSQDNAN